MKRSSISIIGLGLFLVTIFSSFSQKSNSTVRPISLNADIRYQVNVNLSTELSLCNTYLVQVLDGQQRLVAPSRPYIPGVSTYTFFERGPVTGVRVAVLVRASFDNFICQQELFTSPNSMAGLFQSGRTYYFELDPQIVNHFTIK